MVKKRLALVLGAVLLLSMAASVPLVSMANDLSAYPDVYDVGYGKPAGVTDALWDDAFEFSSFKGGLSATYDDAKDSGGSVKLLWDDKNLYALAQITDPTLEDAYPAWYSADGVTFFMQEEALKDGESTLDTTANFNNAGEFAASGIQLKYVAANLCAGYRHDFTSGVGSGVVTPNSVDKAGGSYLVMATIPFTSEKKADELIKFEAKLSSFYSGAVGNEQYLCAESFNDSHYGTSAYARIRLTGQPSQEVEPSAYPDIYDIGYGQPSGLTDALWDNAFSFPSFKGGSTGAYDDTKDSGGSVKLLWDNNGLYALAEISDPTLEASYESIPWYWADGVTFFVKEDALKDGVSTFEDTANFQNAAEFGASGIQLKYLAATLNGCLGHDFTAVANYSCSMLQDIDRAGGKYVVQAYIPFTTEKDADDLIKFEAKVTSYHSGAMQNNTYLCAKVANDSEYGLTAYATLKLTGQAAPDPTKPVVGHRPGQDPMNFEIGYGTPKIDGKGSDPVWNSAQWHAAAGTVEEGGGGMVGPYAHDQKAKFLWDSEFLYVLSSVKDPTVSNDYRYYSAEVDGTNMVARPFTADGVCIDMWDKYDGTDIQSSAQIPVAKEADVIGAWYNGANFIDSMDDAFQMSIVDNESYTIEFRIPFSDLRQNGDTLKLELSYNDWNPDVTWNEYHDRRSFSMYMSNPLNAPWYADADINNSYDGAATVTLTGKKSESEKPEPEGPTIEEVGKGTDKNGQEGGDGENPVTGVPVTAATLMFGGSLAVAGAMRSRKGERYSSK